MLAIFLISVICCTCTCKPVINSFRVTTHDSIEARRITTDDTLKVNWDIKGKPTLLIHEKSSNDSLVKTLEVIMVVEKGGKVISRPVQVEILPKNSVTSITLSTKLSGDTLVAIDEKNPGVWGDRFEILTVSNASGRPLIVWHANKSAVLSKNEATSSAFAGTPVEGRWELRSLLTATEKMDHSTLPERLQINATINYKRR